MLSIIILSIIQGVSEFLPISSSAHLIIFRDIFLVGSNVLTKDIELTFDIAPHFGTIISIIVYFYNDLYKIIKSGLKQGLNSEDGKILLYIIIATIPGAFFGVLFEDIVENFVRNNYILIILSLTFMGIIIYYVDKIMKQDKSFKEMSLKDALIIGLFQVLALIPGFSRSGTTILAARCLKMNRIDASKFSFYLSIPIVLGAVLLRLIKTDFNILINNFNILLIGIIVSFIIGLICIRLLLGYVKNNDFKIFMWYRIGLSIIVFLLIFFII